LVRPLFIVWNHLKPDEQFAVCTERVFWTLNRSVPTEVHYMEKNADIFDDMGVSKLLPKVFSKVNYYVKSLHFILMVDLTVRNFVKCQLNFIINRLW